MLKTHGLRRANYDVFKGFNTRRLSIITAEATMGVCNMGVIFTKPDNSKLFLLPGEYHGSRIQYDFDFNGPKAKKIEVLPECSILLFYEQNFRGNFVELRNYESDHAKSFYHNGRIYNPFDNIYEFGYVSSGPKNPDSRIFVNENDFYDRFMSFKIYCRHQWIPGQWPKLKIHRFYHINYDPNAEGQAVTIEYDSGTDFNVANHFNQLLSVTLGYRFEILPGCYISYRDANSNHLQTVITQNEIH